MSHKLLCFCESVPRTLPHFGLGLLLLGLCASGCGTGNLQQNAPKGDSLMGQTAVGQNRCAEAAKTHSKPFVIEWDATDLSTFESRATRDMLFVKFEGCNLEVLYGCSDNSIPGKYGTYAQPSWTSGAVESIDIQNQDELYAKLPLGVATLGGRVQSGEALKMSYYVSAVATATRDKVFRGELKTNPACQGATHFVWAYNLGAFEINSSNKTKIEGDVGVGAFGGGGSHAREGAKLRKGGSLDSCTSQDQRSCRVPIRLVLRPLDEGDAPTATPGMPPATAQGNQGPGFNSEAYQMRQSAQQKANAGDGSGCLDDLAKADHIDPHPEEHAQNAVNQLRAECEMLAGKCDEGKKHYRQAMASLPVNKAKSDAELDLIAETMAKVKCKGAANPTAVMVEISQASAQRDGATCSARAQSLEAMLPKLGGTPIQGDKAMALSGMQMAVQCLARSGRCEEANTLHKKVYQIQFPTTKEADRAKVFEAVAPDCKKK